MAWIVVDLDDTLVTDSPTGVDPLMGDQPAPKQPVDGAVEAMQMLASEGHRLTVFTARFAPAPATEKERLKQEIMQELASYGFPEMEVWTGTTKPAADIFIDNKAITFDQDWGLALAQLQEMLEARGLLPAMQPMEEEEGMPPPDTDPSQGA